MESVTRGDLVTIALQGDFGKPRPALVVQSDRFVETETVTVLPLTSTVIDAPLLRLTVRPNDGNGLRSVSQVMIDKVTTIKRVRVDRPFGRLDDGAMMEVNRAMAVFLGFA